MPDSLTLSTNTLCGFLLVLARVGGALVFVPLPGVGAAAQPARAALALGFTLALFFQWPFIPTPDLTASVLVEWILAEAALGIAIGVCVAVVLEAFAFAAQVLGVQAGYGYASVVDPNTEADSAVLVVFAQLMAGMLFFGLGFDREVMRLLAQSLDKTPPGSYIFAVPTADALIHLASSVFSVGVRLAIPVTALLIMVDVALALLGRLNAQLQLLSLAFPAKMLVSLLVLSWIAAVFPRIFHRLSGDAWIAARRILGF
jgi:flagellar biosynthetic protein FliR